MFHGLENFAFDAFLGKPCLLVAHHEIFRNHGKELTTFIDSMNALVGGVEWRSLEEAITRRHASGPVVDSRRRVRMFANETVFANRSNAATTLLVEKREIDANAVARVRSGSRDLEWTWQAGVLRFTVAIPPNHMAVLKVEYDDPLGQSSAAETSKYRIAVGARRYLSEIRDDYLCRNDLLNRCADRIMRVLK
jgi:hypothetical protein